MNLIAVIAESASMNLIIQRMILLFLPSMSSFASILILAAINCIILDECLHLPILALFLIIVVEMWFSPVILPVMCIDTGISRMVSIAIGAPYCFEIEYKKV